MRWIAYQILEKIPGDRVSFPLSPRLTVNETVATTKQEFLYQLLREHPHITKMLLPKKTSQLILTIVTTTSLDDATRILQGDSGFGANLKDLGCIFALRIAYITLGPVLHDYTTTGWSALLPQDKSILLGPHYVQLF